MEWTFSDRRGFSIVQTVVALAIGMVVSLGIAQVLASVFKNQKSISNRLEITTVSSDLERAIKEYTMSCSCALQTELIPKSGTSLTNLISSSTAEIALKETNLNLNFYSEAASCASSIKKPIFVNGKVLGNNNLYIDSIKFSAPMAMGSGKYLVDLIVSIQSIDKTQMRFKPVMVRNIPLTITSGVLACSKSLDKLANVGCNSGEFLSGFDADAKPICKAMSQTIANLSCGSNSAISGFDSSGTPICKSIVSSTPVPVAPPPSTVYNPPPVAAPASIYPTKVTIPGQLCSVGGGPPDSTIMQQYLNMGRCADSGGYNYWRQNYFNKIYSGVSPEQAQVEIASQIQAGAAAATQANLDSLCPDGGGNYKYVMGTPSNPSSSCTVRCVASPSDPLCAR